MEEELQKLFDAVLEGNFDGVRRMCGPRLAFLRTFAVFVQLLHLIRYEHDGKVLYVATATAGDEEMKTRIENHRAERPSDWRTLEAPLNVGEAIERELAEHPADVVLMDCMTLLATNVIIELPEGIGEQQASQALMNEVESLLTCVKKSTAQWIIVSNEVGLGLVPPYSLGRVYRDALGRANQQLALIADKAILMIAGIPTNLSRF